MANKVANRASKRRRVANGPDEILILDKTDDIDTILDRLEWVEGRHVLIQVPGSSVMLASLVSLRLLARRAAALRLSVILVARDGQTRTLAKEVGLPAYSTRRSGEAHLRRLQKRHGRPVRTVVRDASGVQQAGASPGPRRWKIRKRPRLPGDRFRLRTLPPRDRIISQVFTGLILTALMGALVYTVVTLLPMGTVTIVPTTKSVSETLLVTADLEATTTDFDTRTLPARAVEVRLDGSAEIPTLDKRDAPNQPARGKVIFSNRSGQEVIVPAGTVVRTSTGVNVRFATVGEVTVPAGVGSQVEADIVALTPGPSGNVGPYLITTIEGSAAVLLSVVNEEPTTGGDVTQVGVVTYADRERLKTMLLQRLRQEALVAIQDQLDAQEFVPPETLQVFVISELYDKYVDEVSDTLGLRLQVKASAVAVAGYDANKMALEALEASLPGGYELLNRDLHFERGNVQQIDEKRRVTFSITASGIAKARIDTQGLREALQGQPLAKAEMIVAERLALEAPPEVRVEPDWFDRMPQLPFRINIVEAAEPR